MTRAPLPVVRDEDLAVPPHLARVLTQRDMEAHENAIRGQLLEHLCGPWGRVPGDGRLTLFITPNALAPWHGVVVRLGREGDIGRPVSGGS